jgi:predicted nucleic-acid-binding protein
MMEKIFADTNLFLRYLTNDVPAQADAVETLLRRAGENQIELVTTSMVIAEIVWTLESFYNLAHEDIQAKVFAILQTPGLQVTDADVISYAITWYAEKNVDFIDAYNAAWMFRKNIGKAYSFDQKHFRRFDGITTEAPK